MSGVPANADIVGAYLFWETITLNDDVAGLDQARRRHVPWRAHRASTSLPALPGQGAVAVKHSKQPLLGQGLTNCWTQGDPKAMRMFMADVLHLLPMQRDANDKATGKRLVNDVDLEAMVTAYQGNPARQAEYAPHTVTLPAVAGNQIPESAGASLVVVYVSPDPAAPLKKIVIYDGIHLKSALNTAVVQPLQAFYQSSTTKSAKLTHIVASGQPNNNDQILFNGQVLDGTNAFNLGSASQRGWANPTFDVSSLMNPAVP